MCRRSTSDQAPRIVRNDEGIDQWVFQGQATSTPFGMAATVGWPAEEWGFNPGPFSELRPGCFDVHAAGARHERQRRAGVDVLPDHGRVQRPDVHRSRSTRSSRYVMLQAYNDWHIDEWCAAYPGSVHPPRHRPDVGRGPRRRRDPPLIARKAAGRSASSRRPTPRDGRASSPATGTPCSRPWSTRTWCCACTSAAPMGLIQLAPEAPVDHRIVLPTQVTMLVAQDLLFGPTFSKYPTLRVALSEGGIGWIPFYLDRVDRHFKNQRWIHNDFGGKLPSEVFREHILACFITDPSGVKARHEIGVDILAWECDYPHTDTTWPTPRRCLGRDHRRPGDRRGDQQDHLAELPAGSSAGIPSPTVPKEQATVGALRALARNVDTTRMLQGRVAPPQRGRGNRGRAQCARRRARLCLQQPFGGWVRLNVEVGAGRRPTGLRSRQEESGDPGCADVHLRKLRTWTACCGRWDALRRLTIGRRASL